MSPLTLKYTPTNLPEQKVTKVESSFVILTEHVLHFKAVFYATEPARNSEHETDKALGWEENVYNYFEILMDRATVVQLEKAYQDRGRVWCLCVFCNAYCDPLKLYTKTEEKCDELLTAIRAWRWPVT